MRALRLGLFWALALGGQALGQGLADWNVSPAEIQWDDWTASLGGVASGTSYAAAGLEPGRDAGASLSASLFPHLDRTLDNGWEIGARGAILATHDRLAGDIYGDRTFEKAYLFAQTPYGRFELGEQDGAGYRLAAEGPSVDDRVGIDNASVTFFRDPETGRAFIDMFRLQTAVFASANDAKFDYTSPRWFGIQFAGSYTPYVAHGGLPFVSRGQDTSDRQTNLLEGAANYAGNLGEVSYTLYTGLALGHGDARTAGHADLVDWGAGGEVDYTLGSIALALGGGFRRSNAYAFDVDDARVSGATRAWRESLTATKGPWIAGFEYAACDAGNAISRPGLRESGLEASLGYVINSNLQLTAGWQGLAFHRDEGVFFNNAPQVHLNAEFLSLRFRV